MKRVYAYLTLLFLAFGLPGLVLAATNISADDRWGWNDVVGWLDFYDSNTVNVLSQGLTGYADSSVGELSLDCATSPAGNICGSSDYQVLNDGAGNLSGWGWNDAVGWVSFCGGQSTEDCPGTVVYKVLIDPVNGEFSGWGWNDAVGWVSFNCIDPGLCATSDYKVATDWVATSTLGYLDSSIFDTGVAGGAQINSVVWHGSLPSPANGAFVGFQFAVSDSSSGPWNYAGPDGTTDTYYTPAAPDTTLKLDYRLHNNARYFRYRTTLQSNQAQTSSPRVDAVSVNWSR